MTMKYPACRRLALCLGVVSIALSAAPVARWTFDRPEGSLPDAAGDCHGRFEGEWSAEHVQPGIFGNALRFDAGKRQVRLPHSPAISLRDDFTVECVLKPFRTDSFRTFFWKGDRTVTPEAINYYFDLRDGRPEFKTKDREGRWIVQSTAETVEPNQWHHLVFVRAAGKVEIYLNGVAGTMRISEDGARAAQLVENPHDAFLGDGASPHGSAYSFDGLIDELIVYAGRETGMLGDDYATRWQRLREDCAKREAAFAIEVARREEEARQEMEREYDALFAARATAADAPFFATVLSSTRRLNGSPDFFRHVPEFTRTAVLSAARNEREGFQVILLGKRGPAPVQVSAEVPDLVREDGKARIPAAALSWGRIERIDTEPPDIAVPFVGAIPDAILADGAPVTVVPRDFGSLFCRIAVGDAPPGRYAGDLRLGADGFAETIRIELTVHDFALPRKGSLRTAFCFFESYYRSWYGLKELTDPQREGIYEFLLSHRLSPCNIYSGEAPFPPLRFLEKYRDEINFFTVGRIRVGTEEQTQADVGKKVELFRQIRELGLEESMYFYSFDELSMNMEHLPAAVKTSNALRAAWPELKLMQTSFPIPELQPLYNAWTPLWHEFGREQQQAVLRAMRERGDEIWWYAADAPRHPCPNFFLDYPVFDSRIVGALSFLHGVDGMLYWCVNREWASNLEIREQWPNAPWKAHIYHAHTGARKYKNGMGNLIYPGKEGRLHSSLRLENLRDGLEDYEYLHALRAAVARLAASDSPAAKALLPEARALLAIPPEVAAAVDSWSQDPGHLLAYRDRVGRMLGRIAQLPE